MQSNSSTTGCVVYPCLGQDLNSSLIPSLFTSNLKFHSPFKLVHFARMKSGLGCSGRGMGSVVIAIDALMHINSRMIDTARIIVLIIVSFFISRKNIRESSFSRNSEVASIRIEHTDC